MALYLTILEGASPSDAETIFCTSDERILGAVAAEISRRFGAKDRPPLRKIDLPTNPQAPERRPSDK